MTNNKHTPLNPRSAPAPISVALVTTLLVAAPRPTKPTRSGGRGEDGWEPSGRRGWGQGRKRCVAAAPHPGSLCGGPAFSQRLRHQLCWHRAMVAAPPLSLLLLLNLALKRKLLLLHHLAGVSVVDTWNKSSGGGEVGGVFRTRRRVGRIGCRNGGGGCRSSSSSSFGGSGSGGVGKHHSCCSGGARAGRRGVRGVGAMFWRRVRKLKVLNLVGVKHGVN
mmetsp:Transcript_8125/g.15533  ORF Transcript_8125/g.15533 Transcript_8125/m.15533 type:complete len:220 (-) Transcript_8125:511-1170(-)